MPLSPTEFLDAEARKSAAVAIPREAPGQPGRAQLAYENNNPGNLTNPDGSWQKFASPDEGYKALQGHIEKHAGDTLEQYLNQYAPPSENDTEDYIAGAEKHLGVPRGTRLSALDREKLAEFQARQESSTRVGQQSKPLLSPSQFLDRLTTQDPLGRRAVDLTTLPSQAEFDQSHQSTLEAFRSTLSQGLARVKDLYDSSAIGHGVASANKAVGDALAPYIFAAKTAAEAPLLPLSKTIGPETPEQEAATGPAAMAGRVVRGVGRGLAGTAEALTRPENIGLMVGTGGLGLVPKIGKYLPRALSAYFSVDMFRSAYNRLPEVKDAIANGDVAGAAKAITEAAAQGLLGAAAAKHALVGEAAPVRTATPRAEPPGPEAPAEAPHPEAPSGGAPPAAPSGAPVSPSEWLTRQGELGPKSARESAQVFKREPKSYAELMTEAEDRQKARERGQAPRAPEPTIPEEGEPEAVARARDAYERLAQHLTGRPFAEITDPAEREAITKLHEEGYGTAVQPGETIPAEAETIPAQAETPPTRELPPPTSERPKGPRLVGGRDLTDIPGVREENGHLVVDDENGRALARVPLRDQAAVDDVLEGMRSVRRPEATKGSLAVARAPEPVSERPVSEQLSNPKQFEQREPKTRPAYGHEVEVRVPGEPTVYAARYAVREAEDVHASHNAANFEPNPEYAHANERDYKSAVNAERVASQASPTRQTPQGAEGFDENYILQQSRTAEHGAPVIDRGGNVLGGNSRKMTLERVRARGGADIARYQKGLTERAQQFGIDPAELARFKNPELVRELVKPVDVKKAVADFNKKAASELTPEERAVADGKRMSPATIAKLGGRLGEVEEGATLAEALRAEDGGEVVNDLVKDGVFTKQEATGMVDSRGHLTPETKSRIAKGLVGRLFNNAQEFRITPPALRAKLERVAPQVLRVEGRKEWAITKPVREAVAYIEELRAAGVKFGEREHFETQGNITTKREYSPAAKRIAEVLQDTPKNAEYAFRRYANDEALSAEGSQQAFFEPPSREQAFMDAFGAPPDVMEARLRIVDAIKDTEGSSPRRNPAIKMEDLAKVGEFYVKRGYRALKAWSGRMLQEFGETIKPRLAAAWAQARKFAAETKGESSIGNLFEKGPGDEIATANERDQAALTKERLETKLKAPVTREEQLAKLKRRPPSLWKDLPEQQGGLFGQGREGESAEVHQQNQLGLFNETLTEGSRQIEKTKGFKEWSDAMREFTRDTSGEMTLPDLAKLYPIARRITANPVELAKAVRDFMSPLGKRIERQGDNAGEPLMRLIRRAGDSGEVLAGQMLARIGDTEATKLTKDQRQEVLDILEGRKKTSTDAHVQRVAGVFRGVTDELAGIATGLGLEVRSRSGRRRPFAALEDYFPHVLRPAEALESGPVRRDVLANLVHIGAAKTKAEATALLDDWTDYLRSGQRKENLLQHLVDSGQAETKAEAFAKLQKFRAGIERHGSLEYSRELNLPFYDPDPVRVLPHAAATGAKRLAQVAEFGQDHQRINAEIYKIAEAGGNADFVRKSVDRILGVVTEGNTAEARISRLVRSVESFKLGLSAIPNATQGVLNGLLASDVPSVALGLKDAISKRGRRLAIESGAAIEPVLAEAAKELGGGRAVDLFLRGTGFHATEQFNRATAANIGVRWASKNFEQLKADPKDKAARAKLAELGVDPEAALGRGSLTHTEKLMAAKKFSDITQFRSRPEDLPGWASTPMGKVAFQFKTFSYNQARLIAKQTVGELREGRPGPALRAFLVAAVIFPATGEAVRALRTGITGNERDFDDAIERYWDDLAQASALGLISDAWQAAGRRGGSLEFLAGPAATDLSHVAEILNNGDLEPQEKAAALRDYVARRFAGPFRRLLPEQ